MTPLHTVRLRLDGLRRPTDTRLHCDTQWETCRSTSVSQSDCECSPQLNLAC